VSQISDREHMSLAGEDLPGKKGVDVLVTVGATILEHIQVVITICSFANGGENNPTGDNASEDERAYIPIAQLLVEVSR
jgi:hypothetical protein